MNSKETPKVPTHWLLAAQIITRDPNGNISSAPINAIVVSESPALTRKNLENGQRAAIARFLGRAQLPKGVEIVDCFMLSWSNLGSMSSDEFHAGFDEAKPAVAGSEAVN